MSVSHSSLAPINKLPLELLSDIFVTFAALVRPANSPNYYGALDHAAVTLLSSVCARWRQAAFTIPAFWSSIDLGFLRDGHPPQKLQYIYLQLERSRDYPLHLRIGKHNFECALPVVSSDLAAILQSCAHHLRSLAVIYWLPRLVKEILAILVSKGVSKSLRELALCAVSGDRLVYADPDILPQESLDQLLAPLSQLYLESAALDWNVVHAPCRNLVELQLIEIPMNGYPTASRFIELLAANRGLRSIKLSRFDLRGYPPPSDGLVIELPELQNVELFLNPSFVSWFFSLLFTGTQSLSLHLTSYQIESQISAITTSLNSFFQRSRVKSLCISGYWLPFSSVITTLQYLEVLRLHGQVFTSQTFNRTDNATVSLPMLHTVDMVDCIGIIDDIEPGFRSLLSVPSMRKIGVDHLNLYQRELSNERLLETQSILRWMAEGNVTASISHPPVSEFYAFNSPFR